MEYYKRNAAIDGGASGGGGEGGGGGGGSGQGQGQERGLRSVMSLASASATKIDGISSSDAKPPKVLWPSERIPQGGLFHEPKVVYSKETADLVKLLMAEANISMAMRKKIGEHMRNGEPLPKPKLPSLRNGEPDANVQHILWRARIAKRKSLDKILASGAYDQPMYRPILSNRMPSDKDKRLLQEAMAGMRLTDINMKPKLRHRPVESFEEQTPQELIEELLNQITERADWLAEMEELGEGRKYRDEIREQIAARLRRIKALEAEIEMKKEGFRFVN